MSGFKYGVGHATLGALAKISICEKPARYCAASLFENENLEEVHVDDDFFFRSVIYAILSPKVGGGVALNSTCAHESQCDHLLILPALSPDLIG